MYLLLCHPPTTEDWKDGRDKEGGDKDGKDRERGDKDGKDREGRINRQLYEKSVRQFHS